MLTVILFLTSPAEVTGDSPCPSSCVDEPISHYLANIYWYIVIYFDLGSRCTPIEVCSHSGSRRLCYTTHLPASSVNQSRTQTLSGCTLRVAISTIMYLPYIIYNRSFWLFPWGNTRGEIPPLSPVLLVGVKKSSCWNFNHPNIACFIINEGWTKLQPSRKSNGVESVGSLGRWGSGALPVQSPGRTKHEMGDLGEEVLSPPLFEFAIVCLLSCRKTVEVVTGEAGSGWPSQRRQEDAAECDETYLGEKFLKIIDFCTGNTDIYQ